MIKKSHLRPKVLAVVCRKACMARMGGREIGNAISLWFGTAADNPRRNKPLGKLEWEHKYDKTCRRTARNRGLRRAEEHDAIEPQE